MYASKPYRQAVALQGRIIDESVKAEGLALANLCKSFATLEMLKLRLRMKPAPKAVDVTVKSKVKPQAIEPTE
jgi:hypothetical protein